MDATIVPSERSTAKWTYKGIRGEWPFNVLWEELGFHWINRRMKAIRFHLINIAARVIKHTRKRIMRIASQEMIKLFLRAQE